jgi:thiamine biosynthesis lipoprotein
LENNLNNHLIDIGGEVIINGSINGSSWKVGIQDPSSFIDKPIYVINNLDNKYLSIATSGEYRNFKILDDGKKISHTINPKTLISVSSKVSSVTVVHESSATYADAYATALNVMGEIKAIEFANDNDIAVMLTFTNEQGTNLKFSKKWYDLQL